jgi:agmatine deiminase
MKTTTTRAKKAAKPEKTLREQGLTMPAEWAPHEATWIAFPHHKTDWPGKLSALPWTFAEMARVLSAGERVRVLVQNAAERERAKNTFDRAGVRMAQVDFVVSGTNRSWTRDYAPLFVTGGQGKARRKVAVNFRFDGWGRYRDHKKDDASGELIARRYAKEQVFPELEGGVRAVLEGGSIDVDGLGTLLTTEACLLESKFSRNKGLGREGTEKLICDYLGVDKVIWLPDGVAGDDTSGHVDDFARFVAPGRVVVCDEPNKKDANHAPLKAAQKALRAARDARGKALEVIELPMPGPVTYRDMGRLPASYANFYIGNAAVIVPVFNDANDRLALDVLAACFKDRPVVPIYARDLVLGLGTLHCSTMQEPR